MPKPLAERFWAKVDRSGGPDTCWPWTGCRDKRGYGRLSSKKGKSPLKSHRVAWEVTNGPIPDGKHVLHRCDSPPCCNPGHLFTGTAFENAMDREEKGRGRNELKGRPQRGELNNAAKLSPSQVIEIRRLRAEGRPFLTIAEQFGVSDRAIRNICNGQNWSHLQQEPNNAQLQ